MMPGPSRMALADAAPSLDFQPLSLQNCEFSKLLFFINYPVYTYPVYTYSNRKQTNAEGKIYIPCHFTTEKIINKWPSEFSTVLIPPKVNN